MTRRAAGLILGFLGLGLLAAILIWVANRGTNPDDAELPTIIYIGWDGQSRNQLFLAAPDGQQLVQLTGDEHDVLDYAVSPDGRTVAYSTANDEGGSDLWAIEADGDNRRRLLACIQVFCNSPQWRPSGRELVYERRDLTDIDNSSALPRLWWLELDDGQTRPVFQDDQQVGYAARFSPDGRRLGYVAPNAPEIQVFDLESGRLTKIPSQSGEPPVWSPDGESLLVSDLALSGEQYDLHLFRVDLESGQTSQLTGELATSDGWPAISPNGSRIAFNRKMSRAPMGKQLWLLELDGGKTVRLTNNADIHHGPPGWSADGRHLLFQRFDQTSPEQKPGIWLIDVDSGEMIQVAAEGMFPSWLSSE